MSNWSKFGFLRSKFWLQKVKTLVFKFNICQNFGFKVKLVNILVLMGQNFGLKYQNLSNIWFLCQIGLNFDF